MDYNALYKVRFNALYTLLALLRINKNKIMNIAELKKLINDLPDDFEFEVEVSKNLTKEELEGSKYPYPYIS